LVTDHVTDPRLGEGLLQTVPRILVDGLCLYDRESEVAAILEKVIRAFLGA
jgi:hypothetical protein